MNDAVFEKKTAKNVRKHTDIKLATTKRRRSVLASEPNHHTTKFFRERVIAIKMKSLKYLWINLSI